MTLIGYVFSALYVLIPLFSTAFLDVNKDYDPCLGVLILLLILVAVTTIIIAAAWKTYCYRVAHESMATTFLVILFSLRTLGSSWPSFIALLVGDYVSITVIGIASIIGAILYIIFLWKKAIPLEKENPKDFGFFSETPDAVQ